MTLFHCIKYYWFFYSPSEWITYFSLLNFSPAPCYLNAWNRICATWLCPRVVARRLDVAPSSGGRLVQQIKVVLKPVLRFLNSSNFWVCGWKPEVYCLLCTTMEFEVSSQRMKSFGVSTHIPTKYTKHCFLAIVHCEYVLKKWLLDKYKSIKPRTGLYASDKYKCNFCIYLSLYGR